MHNSAPHETYQKISNERKIPSHIHVVPPNSNVLCSGETKLLWTSIVAQLWYKCCY